MEPSRTFQSSSTIPPAGVFNNHPWHFIKVSRAIITVSFLAQTNTHTRTLFFSDTTGLHLVSGVVIEGLPASRGGVGLGSLPYQVLALGWVHLHLCLLIVFPGVFRRTGFETSSLNLGWLKMSLCQRKKGVGAVMRLALYILRKWMMLKLL